MGFTKVEAHEGASFEGIAIRGHETCSLTYKATSTFDGMVALYCNDHEMDCYVLPSKVTKTFEYAGLPDWEHVTDLEEQDRRAKADNDAVIKDLESAEKYLEDVTERA